MLVVRSMHSLESIIDTAPVDIREEATRHFLTLLILQRHENITSLVVWGIKPLPGASKRKDATAIDAFGFPTKPMPL
jgi:hypothetical protein